jgi:hypothetical protein
MAPSTRPPIAVICALADELAHLRDALPREDPEALLDGS